MILIVLVLVCWIEFYTSKEHAWICTAPLTSPFFETWTYQNLMGNILHTASREQREMGEVRERVEVGGGGGARL